MNRPFWIAGAAGSAAFRGGASPLAHKKSALNRLETVGGHLDAVISMVEDDRILP